MVKMEWPGYKETIFAVTTNLALFIFCIGILLAAYITPTHKIFIPFSNNIIFSLLFVCLQTVAIAMLWTIVNAVKIHLYRSTWIKGRLLICAGVGSLLGANVTMTVVYLMALSNPAGAWVHTNAIGDAFVELLLFYGFCLPTVIYTIAHSIKFLRRL